MFQRIFEFGPAVFVGAALLEVVFGEVVENPLDLCGIAAVEICVGGLVQLGEGEGIGLRWVNRQGEAVLGEAERQGDEGAGGVGFLRPDAFFGVGNDGLQGGEAEGLFSRLKNRAAKKAK
ncbi:hypothetical protein [Neisseria bacilliformis]|uniref:hypothetical protein n=1 Tax=Neisseria bacilliformis TaxID=267212 RepID=UPI0028EEE303|nr:hypothetical protein [Neisseria bacilliformis]